MIEAEDFFCQAEFLAKLSASCSEEIQIRTAINRLYYGIFHLVQRAFNIRIPAKDEPRCHAYVKEQIEEKSIKNDYADLESLRVESDYNINSRMSQKNYQDALELKEKLCILIEGEGKIPYEEDDSFYKKTRNDV